MAGESSQALNRSPRPATSRHVDCVSPHSQSLRQSVLWYARRHRRALRHHRLTLHHRLPLGHRVLHGLSGALHGHRLTGHHWPRTSHSVRRHSGHPVRRHTIAGHPDWLRLHSRLSGHSHTTGKHILRDHWFSSMRSSFYGLKASKLSWERLCARTSAPARHHRQENWIRCPA